LLVGAFENSDGHTIASYMNFIRRDSYADYPVSYAPRGQTWFVLSGESSQNIFYEKVIFSAAGASTVLLSCTQWQLRECLTLLLRG
jgi:hypothetical protein